MKHRDRINCWLKVCSDSSFYDLMPAQFSMPDTAAVTWSSRLRMSLVQCNGKAENRVERNKMFKCLQLEVPSECALIAIPYYVGVNQECRTWVESWPCCRRATYAEFQNRPAGTKSCLAAGFSHAKYWSSFCWASWGEFCCGVRHGKQMPDRWWERYRTFRVNCLAFV